MARVEIDRQTLSLYELNSRFAGRREMDGYDPTKRIHIHQRNRHLAWKPKDIKLFKESLLLGYSMGEITISKNTHARRDDVLDGGNRITAVRIILMDESLSAQERRVIENYTVNICYMVDPTPAQIVEQFRRLNRNIKVSDGQLYFMYIEESPLVQEAVALLEDEDHPLRSTVDEVFSEGLREDNDKRMNLANAIAMVSGAVHGVDSITTAFIRQEINVSETDELDRDSISETLEHVFKVFLRANRMYDVPHASKKKALFNVGKWVAPILYDVLTRGNKSIKEIQKKWVDMMVLFRQGAENSADAITIAGANNIKPDKLARISAKVQQYLDDRTILTETELKKIFHGHCDGEETDTTADDDE